MPAKKAPMKKAAPAKKAPAKYPKPPKPSGFSEEGKKRIRDFNKDSRAGEAAQVKQFKDLMPYDSDTRRRVARADWDIFTAVNAGPGINTVPRNMSRRANKSGSSALDNATRAGGLRNAARGKANAAGYANMRKRGAKRK